MKSWEKWKKIFFVLVSIIVLIRIGYIVFRGELNKQYIEDTTLDLSNAVEIPCEDILQKFTFEHDNINKLAVILKGISDDKPGTIMIQIMEENDLLYQTNVSLDYRQNGEWKQIYTNIPIEKGVEYQLKIKTIGEYTRIPNILYVDGNLAVKFGYLAPPGCLDKAVNSSIWFLLLIFTYILLDRYEFIQKCIQKLFELLYANIPCDVLNAVIEILLCSIIINCSGIEFQEPTKILMYIISLCASFRLQKRKRFAFEMFSGVSKKILLYGLYFYCAFALVGQRMLIYPLNITITISNIFVVIVAVLWGIPVINSIIYIITTGHRYIIHKNIEKMRFNRFKFVGLLIILLLLPAAYNLFANNPGISSEDTVLSMVDNAKHLHGMRDWHPAFYCMVLRTILNLWDSTYAVIFVQYFFWAYVMIEFLIFIRSKGMCDHMIIFIALFCGINAGNLIHLNTIWKDIPYTLSILWSLMISAKLLMDQKKYMRKWYIYLELIVSLVGVCLYRKNGIVSYIVIMLTLAVVLRSNKKAWCSLLISILLIGCIKGPIYHHFEIQDTGRYGMYIGLGQDILGVYYYDGDVSKKTMEMINVMTHYNNAKCSYTPTWSDQSPDLDVELLYFIECYIDTFLKNPILMSRAIIDREDAIWDIFEGKDSIMNCVNYTGTMDENIEWMENYPKRIYRSLYDQMSMETAYTASSQWISAIEWRCGFFSLLGLIAVSVLGARHGFKRYILLVAPVGGHILSLLLSTGWSDFRYFWPLNLMNMCIVLLSLVLMQKEEQENELVYF